MSDLFDRAGAQWGPRPGRDEGQQQVGLLIWTGNECGGATVDVKWTIVRIDGGVGGFAGDPVASSLVKDLARLPNVTGLSVCIDHGRRRARATHVDGARPVKNIAGVVHLIGFRVRVDQGCQARIGSDTILERNLEDLLRHEIVVCSCVSGDHNREYHISGVTLLPGCVENGARARQIPRGDMALNELGGQILIRELVLRRPLQHLNGDIGPAARRTAVTI